MAAIYLPWPVIIGCSLLIFELGRPFRALNLFKVINLSPMSIGSWVLVLFIFTALAYALAFIPSFFSGMERWRKRMGPVLHGLAWVNVPLGIGVAVYTGVLLGGIPSRPFWNSPILALLFLVSSLSTGVAIIILARILFHRKDTQSNAESEHQFHETGYLLTASDLLLIGFELLVIFLFVMFAHLSVGNMKYAIAMILPGGEMAGVFWLWVVLIGLVIPALIELAYVVPRLIYQRAYVSHLSSELIVSITVLVGGFMLRYVVVLVGQMTGPMGI